MKASTEIDSATQIIRVTVEFCEAEAGNAVDVVKKAADTLWPGIVFYEDDAPGVAPESPPKKPRKAADYSAKPAPESLHGRILAFAQQYRRCERDEIAKTFKIEVGIAAMAISRLRKGGHLEGL